MLLCGFVNYLGENTIPTRNKGPKILLVDDEVAILHSLGFFLEQEGYHVTAISKFDSYKQTFEKQAVPDLIILDILLNQEDGCNIAKELKKDPRSKKVPIIMISALPDGKTKAENAGADAFLAKPFDVSELNHEIEQLTHVAA